VNRIIKNSMEKFFRKFGYEIIPSWGLEHDAPLARHLATLFQKLNIRCVLDVGANIGQYREFLRHQVGYDGLIISFEPVLENVNILNILSKQDPCWTIYDFALGSENTTMPINVMIGNDFSSFLNPDDSVVGGFQKNIVDHEENVEVKKLDSILEMLRSKHPITNVFMKTDTQGYDMEVVAGAENTMSEVLALQTEVSVKKIYKNMPNYLEAIQVLNSKGFDVTGIFPISRSSLLRVVEFDCVLINNSLA